MYRQFQAKHPEVCHAEAIEQSLSIFAGLSFIDRPPIGVGDRY